MELALPVDRVFPFFADAGNLEAITPPLLNFQVVTAQPIDMRPGALIDYRLKIRGVPVSWRTEISVYDPPRRFVDRQVKGPYRLWEHTHDFEPSKDGRSTIIRDRVLYELPRVPGRSIVHALVVRPDLRRIFEYRQRTISRLLLGA